MKRLLTTFLSIVFSASVITCTLPVCHASEPVSNTCADSDQENSDPGDFTMPMDAINSTGDAQQFKKNIV